MQPYRQSQQYQRYRPRRTISKSRILNGLILVGIVFVVYLIGRSVFSGTQEVESVLPNSNAFATEQTNTTGTNQDANSNINSAANSNVNTNTTVDMAGADDFDLTGCTGVLSRGKTAQKRVSLTFNVGTAKEGQLQTVLDALTTNDTPASFFARGDVAENNPDLIVKISNAGHPVYNLSYNHPHFNDMPESGIAEQLAKTETAVSAKTGKTTKPFFRPPYGEADEDVVTAVKEAGYCPITWTVDAMDWSSDYTAQQSKERILSTVGNGSIILMQAANSTTAEILPDIITQLKAKGFEIVDLHTIFTS
ncbi:MAG: polysaccharide deacetylase family protein [Patescibacteria group bacterium]|nr:polysaccharide deacetylase family protein [Patescibacteria group bacterium]MDD5715699.1 polysaccharide deacetylase family protein [Patescibacteria group bacterium]